MIKNDLKSYKIKTKKSAELFKKSKKLHVNGVHHNIRFFEPYPFITKSSSGKFLIDVDSNKYVDYWMGHWSLILGHSPKNVRTNVRMQLDNGWIHGTVSKNSIDLSEKISKAVPVAEKIRYASTGTEATMYAVRLARTITKRKTIAKIDGGWHGYTTDLLKTINWPFHKSESSGLTDEKHIISLPYNNLEKSVKILKTKKNDLAAIIIEPVLGGGGCIPATREYLLGIQEFCHKNNILFILDEIVTGFRFRFGCLYNTMKLDPDLVTLGKIVGGGFPIGVICGKNELMKYASTSIFSKTDRAYIGGGTFSANPLTMMAGSTMLTTIKNKGNLLYKKLNSFGIETRKMLDKKFGGSVITTGIGSLFLTHFLSDSTYEINNAADAAKCNIKKLHDYHFHMIAKDGIFFLPGKLGAFSDVHTKSDIANLAKSTDEFLTKFKK
ncbi:aminotransferase class III-fold pyridoxal phosphate-dependent enzyme [Marine Group I thaumarchaeote]|jgi:glutamate-1-semialdehyde 2,1-aminomutase|uniref:Aminotransferase class III-fold pyridoxal phosphate-dependent enzyme n=1 Tax=Marine Group I thaumarchaeote TaxID=2511932 RepID=A0A7K4MXY3_9ARCH|nr:aminotransferase class III-fold pyridoxal phosphate-dependent enzyme [Marine Group I thaumarchaeote]